MNFLKILVSKTINLFYINYRYFRDLKDFSSFIKVKTNFEFEMFFFKKPKNLSIVAKIETDVVKKLVDNYDNFIDIGAFVGFFSLFAKKIKSNINIYCFEPNIKNYNLLIKNLKLNNAFKYNTHNVALSNKNQISFLYGSGQGSSLIKGWGNIITYKKKVKSVTFDDYILPKIPKESLFIKIDVEGYEYQLFEGATQGLQKLVNICIFFENGISKNFKNKNLNYIKIFNLLKKYNFKIYNVNDLENDLVIQDLIKRYNEDNEFENFNFLAIKK